MRRTLTVTALAMVAMLFLGVQPALAARLVEQFPAHAQLDLSPFCDGARDVLDQRDPRTLTTWTDRNGRIVLQTLRTATIDVFTRADGAAMELDETSLVAVRPDPLGGDSSIVWMGRGAIWGDDKASGGPFLLWVTGIVVMKGSFNPKDGTLATSSMVVIGQQTDLCESIDQGLKPRH
jgi:hypothetical protein